MSLLNTVILTYNNIKSVCRVCLEDKPVQLSLSARIESQNVFSNPTINDMLQELTAELIQEETLFPRQICHQCTDLLKTAYTFKLKFEEATHLLTLFSNSVEGQKVDIIEQVVVSDIEPNEPILRSHTSRATITNEVRIKELGYVELERAVTGSYVSSSNQLIYDEETYSCPMCDANLPSTLELRKHIHTHKGFKRYLSIGPVKEKIKFYAKPRNTLSIFNRREILHKCLYCNEHFSAEQFRIHVDNHGPQDQFECDKCERVFKTRINYNIHRLKHSNKYPYWCDVCNRGYVVKKTYEYHLLTHDVSSAELPLQCSYCPKRFCNPKYLYRHHVVHNMKKDKSYYSCNECPEMFKDQNKLKEHTCKSTGEKIFSCSFCEETFKLLSELKAHMSAIHKEKYNGALLKACRVCGQYVMKSNMPIHLRTHMRRKLCDICGKRFVNNSMLQKHMRVHTGEKPFECDQCLKRFPTNQQLQRHLKNMHVGLPRRMCSICGKSFQHSYFRAHEKMHSKEVKKHVCPVCDHCFDFKNKLQKHFKKYHECAE